MSQSTSPKAAQATAASHDPGLSRRVLGVPSITLMIIAASAPLTVVAGGVTTSFAVTGSLGVPLGFVLIAVILTLFAVGYTAMGRYVTNAGAFYAYVSQGLGRVAVVDPRQAGNHQLAGIAAAHALHFALDAVGRTQDPGLVTEDPRARLGPGLQLHLAAHAEDARHPAQQNQFLRWSGTPCVVHVTRRWPPGRPVAGGLRQLPGSPWPLPCTDC